MYGEMEGHLRNEELHLSGRTSGLHAEGPKSLASPSRAERIPAWIFGEALTTSVHLAW